MKRKQENLTILIQTCLDNAKDLLDKELQDALADTLARAPKEENRLLAVRLSAPVSHNLLKLGTTAPKELIELATFIQKEEAHYKKGIIWSSIFGSL